jgi:hypothetical protein
MTRRLLLGIGILALLATWGYLRDPFWLASMESGFRAWETGPDGLRYRWTSGHASFFVPSTAASIMIPIRTTFGPKDAPVNVSITIDDYQVAHELLTDDGWVTRIVKMPSPASRRFWRIDLRVDRLRAGNRGVQVGEMRVLP